MMSRFKDQAFAISTSVPVPANCDDRIRIRNNEISCEIQTGGDSNIDIGICLTKIITGKNSDYIAMLVTGGAPCSF